MWRKCSGVWLTLGGIAAEIHAARRRNGKDTLVQCNLIFGYNCGWFTDSIYLLNIVRSGISSPVAINLTPFSTYNLFTV